MNSNRSSELLQPSVTYSRALSPKRPVFMFQNVKSGNVNVPYETGGACYSRCLTKIRLGDVRRP